MTLTRQHFQLIADVIRTCQWDAETPEAEAMRQTIAKALAAQLSGTNGRFDRDRFLTACGVK